MFKSNVLGKDDMFGEKVGWERSMFEIQYLLQGNACNPDQRLNLRIELDLLWKRHNLLVNDFDEEYKKTVLGRAKEESMTIGKGSLLDHIMKLEPFALTDSRKLTDMKALLRQWEMAQHVLIGRKGLYRNKMERAVF